MVAVVVEGGGRGDGRGGGEDGLCGEAIQIVPILLTCPAAGVHSYAWSVSFPPCGTSDKAPALFLVIMHACMQQCEQKATQSSPFAATHHALLPYLYTHPPYTHPTPHTWCHHRGHAAGAAALPG